MTVPTQTDPATDREWWPRCEDHRRNRGVPDFRPGIATFNAGSINFVFDPVAIEERFQ
jgi:hypothetical protein